MLKSLSIWKKVIIPVFYLAGTDVSANPPGYEREHRAPPPLGEAVTSDCCSPPLLGFRSGFEACLLGFDKKKWQRARFIFFKCCGCLSIGFT